MTFLVNENRIVQNFDLRTNLEKNMFLFFLTKRFYIHMSKRDLGILVSTDRKMLNW